MTLSYTTPPSPTAPLACDCLGAVVYIKLLSSYRDLTRDGHGVLRAQLSSRSQSADGTWTYSFVIDESGLVTPTPAVSSGMIQSICCEGCLGFAMEAYNQGEFGGRHVPAADVLVTAGFHVRYLMRPFLLQDWRAWVDVVSPTGDVEILLFVNNLAILVEPLMIRGGETVSDPRPNFIGGTTTYLIPEGASVAINVTVTGPAPKGLEVWFFGHLNPSPYL